MNVQDLKNSILQLAIQGKLVEQREEEGSVKNLLDLIRAEKERLINEKKIKKGKPSPAINVNEIPFDIPESWEWVRIVDLCEKIGSGSTPTGGKSVYKENGIMFLRSQNVYDDGLRTECVAYISAEQNKSGSIVQAKDILLNITGGSIGRCALVPDDFKIANINQHVMIIRNLFHENRFYLHYALISPYIQSMIMSVQVGVSREGLSAEKLKSFLIPLPPLEEQKRIVAKIEELMPHINKYGESYLKLETLNKKFPEDMQKSILQYAIKGKLVEQRAEEGTAEDLYQQIQAEKARLVKEGKIKKDKPLPEITEDEIPFEIPESWKWVRLGEIGITNIGLTYKPSDISNDGTIVLRSSNIQNGYLDFKDIVRVSGMIPESKMCRKGDILICSRNGSKRLVGKAAMINDEGMSFGAFMAIFRSMCNEYLLYLINSPYFTNTMLPETGTTTINQITQDTLKYCIVPLPPIEEQSRIVIRIEELLPHCKQLKK